MAQDRPNTELLERLKSNRGIAPLEGKRGIVMGVANDSSIAWGCAQAFRGLGAELCLTYLNEKMKNHTQDLAEALDVSPNLYLPCNVLEEGQIEAVFEAIEKNWGKLDFALHSIAFAPLDDLRGRVIDCSLDGFLLAMNISCHSFIRMARLAEPMMKDGGALFTMSYFGAEKAIEGYNVMGPVKAALESTARYLAAELGPKGIRVNPISPGPIKTRAASGLEGFDEMLAAASERTPARALVTIEDVGMATAFLATDHAKLITGDTVYVDGGYRIVSS